MNLFSWFTRDKSVRRGVLAHYKRGLTRIKKRDQQGAMNDFSAAIDTAGAPADVKAMALYNRALLFAAENDTAKAIEDLEAVLAVPEPIREMKQAARRRLERMQHQIIAEQSSLHKLQKPM